MRSRLTYCVPAALVLAGCASEKTPTGPPQPEPVASISVAPDAASVPLGKNHQLTVTLRDAGNNILTGRTVQWSTSNPAIVTVDSSGLVRSVATGVAEVTATVEGRTARSRITVVGAYNIEVRYLSTPSTRLQTSIDAAVARWSGVITGDIPDIPVSLSQGQCFSSAPSITETVDDLLVFVEVVPLSGFSGFTNVCWIRTSGNFPIIARIQFNVNDVNRMFAEGWGDNLVLHEFGHAVGMLDFIWTRKQLTDFTDPANPLFTGSAAKAAFQALIDGIPPGAAVPLENEGPPGTIRTHWRRSVFDGEVMTPWVFPGSVLSSLTISALQDLGFQVNRSAAQPFRGRTAVQAGATAGVLVSDDVAGPVGSIDSRGAVALFAPQR